ncbi:MAG: hypothetical protein QXV01_11350 [Candidatus Bathyarchaeia archaeon]
MSERKTRIREDGTLSGCIGQKKPITPNICDECPKHSDLTCKDVKGARKSAK